MTGARIQLSPERWTFYGADGEVRHELQFSPRTDPPVPAGCDCCEQLPAGTVACALGLLGDDRPDVTELLLSAQRDAAR